MPFEDDKYIKPWKLEYSDTWNMDTTIAMFFDDIITAQLDGGIHGYPAVLVCDDPDNPEDGWWENESMLADNGNDAYHKWIAIMTEIRDAFRSYHTIDRFYLSVEEQKALIVRVENAFLLLSKWFPSMWD